MATAWSSVPTFTAGAVITAAQMSTVSNNLKLAGDRPAVFTTRNTGQAIATGTNTAVSWNATEVLNNDAMHSTSLNQYQITCVTPGYYLVAGAVSFPSVSSSNPFTAFVQKYTSSTSTQSVVLGSAGTANPSAGTLNQLAFVVKSNPCIVNLAVGDYVSLYVYHEHGSSLTTYEGGAKGQNSSMLVQWVAPS